MKMNDLVLSRRKKLISLQRLRNHTFEQEKTIECPSCQSALKDTVLKKNYNVCPNCNHYFSMTARQRIYMLADEGSFKEHYAHMKSKNPLDFPNYPQKLDAMRQKTELEDAIVTGTVRIYGMKAAIGVLDGRFLMGSMGTVVGEKIALLAEYAMKKKLPLIIFSASGGARMQEGLFSLMQMVKTSAAVERFKNSGRLFISCLTNPTTGGVSASYASLGDIIIAEPGALICFAGPRVIEQTIHQTLPEGFQHAEFLLEHGMLDMIVERKEMKDILYRLIMMHAE